VALARVRVEHQTLRRLPASGDILFTIRIHLDPLAALARRPDRAELASSFADQLEALTQEQAAYKGIAADRANLAAAIRGLA
jgi:dimethylamine monooxygenase subunit A